MGVQQAYSTFECGGSVSISGNAVDLENIVPGDKVEFDVVINNNSNVITKFKISTEITGELAEQLTITIPTNSWTSLEVGSSSIRERVSIELPVEVGNEYQNKSASIEILVKAVQGNVDVCEHLSTSYIYDSSYSTLKRKCDDCNKVFDLTEEDFAPLEGKVLVEQDGKIAVTDDSPVSIIENSEVGSTTNIYLYDGTFEIGCSRDDGERNINIYGIVNNITRTRNVKINSYFINSEDVTLPVELTGVSLYLNGISVVGQKKECSYTENYFGLKPKNLTASDCGFLGYQSLLAEETFLFYCNIQEGYVSTTENVYPINIHKGKATFENCTFFTSGRAVKIFDYNTGSEGYFKFDACTFNVSPYYGNPSATQYVENAVEIDSTNANSYIVDIINCNLDGHTDFWNDSAEISNATVTVS